MAWERPQADKRWDDLAVAHIDEIAKGLRPREFEKKLVELLDPTLMQAPPSASDRRVSVDIAGRKMYSAVALKAHRLKARVGDAVSHLAVRNGCSARCLGELLGRCKIDGHVENADGETVLDVALNVGAPEDVVACVERWLASPEALAELCESPTRSRKVRPFVTKAADKGFAAAPPGEAAPRPATASLRRPASRSGLTSGGASATPALDRRWWSQPVGPCWPATKSGDSDSSCASMAARTSRSASPRRTSMRLSPFT